MIDTTAPIDIKSATPGCKIYFAGERIGYTIKTCSKRYLICTKPYNPKKTVLYTIVDLKEEIRGTNNLVFNMYDYAKQKDIDKCMKDLISGESDLDGLKISRRNRVPLQVVKILNKHGQEI